MDVRCTDQQSHILVNFPKQKEYVCPRNNPFEPSLLPAHDRDERTEDWLHHLLSHVCLGADTGKEQPRPNVPSSLWRVTRKSAQLMALVPSVGLFQSCAQPT